MPPYEEFIAREFDKAALARKEWILQGRPRLFKVDTPAIKNPSRREAKLIVSAMAQRTTGRFDVVTGQLSVGVHEARDYLDLLDRNGKVRVLIEPNANAIEASGRLVRDGFKLIDSALVRLQERIGKGLDVWVLPRPISVHFAVADGFMYRIETDHDRCEAIAIAGDPDGAANLDSRFADLLRRSRPLETPMAA